MSEDKEYRVVIPIESFRTIEFIQEEFLGFAVVNESLAEFQPKEVFAWHCSIMLECEQSMENRLPSKEEVKILEEFGDYLDEKIKGQNKEKPNGIFLAKITWNRTRELIWRIFDPELTNDFLTDIIERKDHLRNFDYRIDPDEDWKLTEWHLMKR